MTDTATSLILTIAGVGVVLIWIGWTWRVRDGGLYCAACNYRVDPGGAAICSECGTVLSDKTVVAGRRERRYLPITIGTVLVTLSIGVISTSLLGALHNFSFTDIAPTWYLLRADVSSTAQYGDDAVMELRARTAAGNLNLKSRQRFTDLLARRAADMFADPALRRSHVFSGMTLELLRTFKPPDPLVDTLLENVLANEIATGHFQVSPRDGIIHIRQDGTIRFDPSYFLFDQGMPYPSLVGVLQSEGSLANEPPFVTDPGGAIYRLRSTTTDLTQPVTVRVHVDWFLDLPTGASSPSWNRDTFDAAAIAAEESQPRSPWHSQTVDITFPPAPDSASSDSQPGGGVNAPGPIVTTVKLGADRSDK